MSEPENVEGVAYLGAPEPTPPSEHPLPALRRLPEGLYIGANRYHTDNEEVLHLWNAAGESFDIRWPRQGFEHPATRIARALAPYDD